MQGSGITQPVKFLTSETRLSEKTGLHVEISEKRNMEFGIMKCAKTHY